jgi:hypothetical protein
MLWALDIGSSRPLWGQCEVSSNSEPAVARAYPYGDWWSILPPPSSPGTATSERPALPVQRPAQAFPPGEVRGTVASPACAAPDCRQAGPAGPYWLGLHLAKE